MNDLALLVPSRGRPDNVRRLLAACRNTAPDVHVVIGVDGDDPCLGDYRAIARSDIGSRSLLCINYHDPGHQRGMVASLNAMAETYAERYWALGFMGDDHVPRTSGWDRMLLDELVEMGNTGIVYGNDLIQGAALPTAVVMTSDIPLTLGWMAPPTLGHLYVDNAWLALGRAIDRITYLPDVVIEHLHPVAGKASRDAGYDAVSTRERWSADRAAYEDWVHDGLMGDVAKIRAMIEARTDRG